MACHRTLGFEPNALLGVVRLANGLRTSGYFYGSDTRLVPALLYMLLELRECRRVQVNPSRRLPFSFEISRLNFKVWVLIAVSDAHAMRPAEALRLLERQERWLSQALHIPDSGGGADWC